MAMTGKEMLEALTSQRTRGRQARAARFERISGGGLPNMLCRLVTFPDLYLPYVVFAKLGLARAYASSVELFWGRRVRIPLADYDVLTLAMYGGFHGAEERFTRFLLSALGPRDVFYDVGANLGFYTYLAAECAGEVHAFEPVPRLAAVITRNVGRGDNVSVNAIALSDTGGTATFYTGRSTMLGTLDASVAGKLKAEGKAEGAIMVPLTTLDEYAATHTPPTLLKIDAEGAEGRIIAGGSTTLEQHAPLIAMEVWGKGNTWELSMAAVEKLRAAGYRSHRINEDGTLTEVAGDLAALVAPEGGENFVFKKGASLS